MALLVNSSEDGRAELLRWPSSWLAGAFEEYARRVADPAQDYPCHFGVRGHRDGLNWFTMLDADPAADHGVPDLAATMAKFASYARTGPPRQTLIVFAGPPDPAPDYDRDADRFWAVLSGLTAVDPRPWPAEWTTDVRDAGWQWCFGGEPWFVFGCSPAYRRRRSRNLGPCLTFVFQLRRVFENLSGSSPAGQAAKHQIRRGLARYDGVPVHPHLGDARHSSVYKWRQYLLPDDQRILAPEGCPFRVPGGSDGR